MVTVYFATNRNLIGTAANPDFGPAFNPDGPGAIRLGVAEVPESVFTDDDKLAEIVIRLAPERVDLENLALTGSEAVFEEVRQKMCKHARDTVAFLHGYGNTFRNALRHAALLKVIYSGIPFNMFLFSWPSDGEMVPLMSYYSDRTDAKASGPAMARTFLKLFDFLQRKGPEERCNQRIHLMAHSMGNFALRNAVQGIRAELGDELPRLFENIFLLAADEDDDAFECDHKLRLLPKLGRAVQIYFNAGDGALLISDTTKNNPDRLGSDGPRLIDDLPRKVILVDCREVAKSDKRDKHGHDYHRFVAAVIADINHVLRGVLPDQVPGRTYVPNARAYRIGKSAP